MRLFVDDSQALNRTQGMNVHTPVHPLRQAVDGGTGRIMPTKYRESNYDLLRILSCVAIIVIHVATQWVDIGQGNQAFLAGLNRQMLVNIYDSLSRFAVPCFVMISGAFILDNPKNLDYKTFYRKSFRHVVVPTFIFTILYTLFKAGMNLAGTGSGWGDVLSGLVAGKPFYHMWYLYMLIGVYLLAPWVIRVKSEIGERMFERVAVAFLLLAVASMWTMGEVKLAWNLGMVFCYLGYFAVGYVLRKRIGKSAKVAVLALSAGLLIEVFNGVVYYWAHYVSANGFPLGIVGPFTPLVALSSVLIFVGFASMDVKAPLGGLANMTFVIYLFHAGVVESISMVLVLMNGKDWMMGYDPLYWVWIFVLLVSLVSVMLTVVYDKLFDALDARFSITDGLTRLVRLDG